MRLVFFSFFILFSLTFYGENKDSLAVINAEWIEKSVDKGIRVKQIHFKDSSLFNSNQFLSVLEIEPKALKKYRFAVSAYDTLARTSAFVSDNDALAGINGSYFAFGKPYNSVDYIRVGGVELAPNDYKDGNKRLFHQGGALVINDGLMNIAAPVGDSISILSWEKGVKAHDIMTSGPLLLFDGIDIPGNNTSHYTARHPRSVVATFSNGIVWLIAIDGRSKEAAGMTLDQVRSVFKWLGANSILNLDGGGSTALVVDDLGVINHPTDNKTFDNKGERKVANAVLLIKRK